MKKQLIAGAASAVLAAMPVMGAFAASSSIKDTVTLNIKSSCTMTSVPVGGYDGATGGTINFGDIEVGHQTDEKAGSVMTVSCNSPRAWQIKATATDMKLSGEETTTIPFGNYPDTAGVNSKDTASVWSARLAVEGTNTTTATGWDTLVGSSSNAKTTTETEVVTSAGLNSGATISTYYRAFVSGTQKNGTYTGDITYAFTSEAE